MKKIYTKAMIGMLTLTMAIGVGALLSNVAVKNTNHNSNNVNSVNTANAVKIDGNNAVSPDYVIATKIYNDRYGYYLSKSNSTTINECLYHHSNHNNRVDAAGDTKIFIYDDLGRYSLDPNIKLW